MTLAMVTGGTGAIGAAICRAFHAAGFQVIALDLTAPEQDSNILPGPS